jgi:hypothetical protein
MLITLLIIPQKILLLIPNKMRPEYPEKQILKTENRKYLNYKLF